MKKLKKIWESFKQSIIMPLDQCPTCKSMYPDKYFQNGGGCRNCGYRIKPETK